ncbi:hypothetical protein J6590_053638 [Homalodisca vitripennis]|nr:hypothetical protein J6590_053638 [Homalodisca vitripennis]
MAYAGVEGTSLTISEKLLGFFSPRQWSLYKAVTVVLTLIGSSGGGLIALIGSTQAQQNQSETTLMGPETHTMTGKMVILGGRRLPLTKDNTPIQSTFRTSKKGSNSEAMNTPGRDGVTEAMNNPGRDGVTEAMNNPGRDGVTEAMNNPGRDGVTEAFEDPET